MADTKEKDNISRGKFLKMLCAGVFILATGGLAGLVSQ